ncbi:BolA-like protein (modular protein) [Hyphomicrobium sp. MC1]|nr:BolA-like protein (modular protein) [Hyphomicrobium sp. MC1]
MRYLTPARPFEAWLLLCIEATMELGATLMAMDGREIEKLIKQAFPDAHVVVIDMAGDGDHFAARVTSSAFKGKNRIQQHQMVYSALKGQMGGVLHALALETLIPE